MGTSHSFRVLGESVEVLVSSQATKRSFCMLVQTSPSGGGPPPHLHEREDEIFTVLEGEYELFDGSAWHPLRKGEYRHTLRGQVHTFRNAGSTEGKVLIIVTPGGLDEYLEAISTLEVPRDLQRLTEISHGYGIKFVTAQPLTAAPI